MDSRKSITEGYIVIQELGKGAYGIVRKAIGKDIDIERY